VQKAIAAVDWCRKTGGNDVKVAIAGYGEGGQIAMYAAALDTRIDAALVSGYFGPRESLWQEPLHRNVWALLDEFGDAEIASLIAPRSLIIEYSQNPEWKRNVPNTGPGEISTPSFDKVNSEFKRIDSLLRPNFGKRSLISGNNGARVAFGSKDGLKQIAGFLGVNSDMVLSSELPVDSRRNFDPLLRQERAVKQMENHTQLLLRNSEYYRDKKILSQLSFDSIRAYAKSSEKLRHEFQYEHIGWLDESLLQEMNPRSRKIYDEEEWEGYDVVLDVWPDVFAWGVLCIPKDIKPGEKRPVVICQHGLEGTPYHTIDTAASAYRGYKSFAARLAERGFITFAPHNLYRGHNEFRMMQRKANPLKASLFSIITPQHTQILNWLETLPYVDKDRIGFYGLSYGGKSAMRIPAIEQRYKLSICSADFNEWVRVNADIHFPDAYMYRGEEYEMVEWDLGHSFNYAEMTYLIAPRPFMVERGRSDGVGIDPWIAYEFDRARRVYDSLGISENCIIEYFDGPHTINGVGTFEFLQQELGW
jgi:dienelactone hydrolase